MGCLLFYLQGEVGEQGLAGRPGEKVCSFIHFRLFIQCIRLLVSAAPVSLVSLELTARLCAFLSLPRDRQHVLCIPCCAGYQGHHRQPRAVEQVQRVVPAGDQRGPRRPLTQAQGISERWPGGDIVADPEG